MSAYVLKYAMLAVSWGCTLRGINLAAFTQHKLTALQHRPKSKLRTKASSNNPVHLSRRADHGRCYL